MGNLSKGSVSENRISTEERQIRDDLEADIEDNLECEIIENMCCLAHHLQRLYQHRDARQLTGSTTDCHILPPYSENKVVWEMNIRIQLNAQCRIDITKIEKGVPTIQSTSCPSADHSGKKSLKISHSDAIHSRKQNNHPILPWR